MTWGFGKRRYWRMLEGRPLPWELQQRVALIDDDEWAKGPERVGEVSRGLENSDTVRRPGPFGANDWSASPVDDLLEPVELPEQDDLLWIDVIDGKLDVRPSHLTEEEVSDRVRRTVHERLKDAVRDLARAAGNIIRGWPTGRDRWTRDMMCRWMKLTRWKSILTSKICAGCTTVARNLPAKTLLNLKRSRPLTG